jgi:hypothetical protein
MRVLGGFPDAFHDVVGITVESFATDFRGYLGRRDFVPASAVPMPRKTSPGKLGF